MDVTMWILHFVFSFILGFTSASNCRFPLEWQGSWYQDRRGEIQISPTTISSKGTCVQRDGFKFLLFNSHSRCSRCLVVTQMHENLLQYKESLCWSEESLANVCGRISVDATLQTIIKVPSIPVPCPFRGPYEFSYYDGSMGSTQCASPVSQVQACADPSKFKFVYKSCHGAPGTFDGEYDFQCLATWENGEKFLYGKFTNIHIPDGEQMYRCFMHSFYGSTGDMSMSADATCQGLQSPTIGVSTMSMSKVDWPRPNCVYPDFFSRRAWRDLTGSYRIEVMHGGHEFRITDRFSANSGTIVYDERSVQSQIKLSLRCYNLYEVITDSSGRFRKQKTYITYATNDDCKSGYQCIKLTKRSNDVLELGIGKMAYDDDVACEEYQFHQEEKFVLIADEGVAMPCPFLGQYTYTDKGSLCRGEFKIGCKNVNEVIIETECPGNQRSVEILQCMHVWEEDEMSYVITQKPISNDNSVTLKKSAECLAFTRTGNGIEVHSDPECGGNRLVIMSEVMNVVLHTPSEPCQSKWAPHSTSTPQNAKLAPKGPSDFSSIINSGVPRTRTTNCLFVGLLLCSLALSVR
ncbi:hypothetical protein ScPMuIL_006635 [Solemya velum]